MAPWRSGGDTWTSSIQQAFIIARVPRIQCPACGVRLITVPWVRAGSGFTLLMEGLILEMSRSTPVRNIAQFLCVLDNRVWRVIKHYVDDAVSRIDCSKVKVVGVDETSAKKRHDYISCFFDMESR